MSQSIDFSAVTDATFNGSAVEQINLNGVGVWTMPVSSSKLMTTINLNSGSACTVITSNTPQLGWLTVGSSTQVPDGYAIEVRTPVGGANSNNFDLVTKGGEVYIGVQTYNFPSGANISHPTQTVTHGIRVQADNQCGQNAVATAFSRTSVYYLMAKMTPDGLEPVGNASNSYLLVSSGADSYGNPIEVTSYADWVITSTTYKQRIWSGMSVTVSQAETCTTAWSGQRLWNWCYPTTMTTSGTVSSYFTFA